MGANGTPHNWTPDRIAELRRLWTRGDSARMIADALGGVTRNAVLGKAHRLGLEDRVAARGATTVAMNRARPARKQLSAMRKADNRQALSGITAHNIWQRVTAAQALIDKPFEDAPLLVDVTLARPWIDRAFGQCAYPVSGQGADTWSCCAPVDVGAYCDAHRKIMFVKRTPPKISTDTLRVDKPRRRAAA